MNLIISRKLRAKDDFFNKNIKPIIFEDVEKGIVYNLIEEYATHVDTVSPFMIVKTMIMGTLSVTSLALLLLLPMRTAVEAFQPLSLSSKSPVFATNSFRQYKEEDRIRWSTPSTFGVINSLNLSSSSSSEGGEGDKETESITNEQVKALSQPQQQPLAVGEEATRSTDTNQRNNLSQTEQQSLAAMDGDSSTINPPPLNSSSYATTESSYDWVTASDSILAVDPSKIEIVTTADRRSLNSSSSSEEETPEEFDFVSAFRGSANYITNHRNTIVVYHVPGDLLIDEQSELDGERRKDL